jgi:hypothetical protein
VSTLITDPEQVALLRKTLEHVTAHPDEWNQWMWASKTDCGTAYCLAGTACVLAGEEIDWRRTSAGVVKQASYLADGQSIEKRARELLGLGSYAAVELFEADNRLRELWTLANEFTGGAIDIPDTFPDES